MARIFTQSGAQKSAFLKRVDEKAAAQRQHVRERVDAEIPKILHWALTPLATAMVRTKQRRDSQQGARGEFAVSWRLWARLPKAWAIINDVVLEYQPGEYAQIDHIAIGPGGIFLIETKAWDGAILLKNDECFRKEAGKWVKTHSPIHQHNTHRRRFHQWYALHGLPQPLPPIEPIVVFTQARWLVADQCSMPVLKPRQAMVYLTKGADCPLDEVSVDRIVDKILTATPLPMTTVYGSPTRFPSPTDPPVPSGQLTPPNASQIREGTNRAGRKYVRIRGTREVAHKVWEQYGKPGKLLADRFDKETFFFYCD
ncbi:MAG: nuclease-related domain-containing protein [Thermaerobacter sp.]|nr:nuclease-related domain-containing protein [Thermaerobacter sp.]